MASDDFDGQVHMICRWWLRTPFPTTERMHPASGFLLLAGMARPGLRRMSSAEKDKDS